VGEESLEPEYFIVAPARIECHLLDDVRGLIGRDVHGLQEISPAPGIDEIDYCAVDNAATGECGSQSERRGGRAAAEDRGRVFHRHADCYSRGDVAHEAELPLAGIIEPDNIVGVDRERDVLLARRDPDLVLRQQAPRLAAEEVKSIA